MTEAPRPTAATLIATYESRRGITVILTRRPDTMRRHPGQIAFPGGMIEPADASPIAAAFREAREEIGLVVPGACRAVALTPVATLATELVIQPFWVRLPDSPRLRRHRAEVAAILRIPLADLRRPGARSSVPHPRRPGVEVPAFVWRGEVIWGATLRSLDELIDRLDNEPLPVGVTSEAADR